MRRIPDDLAFNKGVDWFTEVVFFYFAMFGIAFYEMNKSYQAALKTSADLDRACQNNETFKTKLDIAKTDLGRIETLQKINKKNVSELEQRVSAMQDRIDEKLKAIEAKI